MSAALDDGDRWGPLPADADGLCEECDEPGELVERLCGACRCACCGSPAAPVEHRDLRWCRACALDDGWRPLVALEMEPAE